MIDQLTKKKHDILCHIDKNYTTAKLISYLLYNNLSKLHKLPLSLIGNLGPQFISEI